MANSLDGAVSVAMKGLDELASLGADLKTKIKLAEPLEVSMAAAGWKARVAEWIRDQFPDSGLSAEWAALPLIEIGLPLSKPTDFSRGMAEIKADQHLSWLASLPSRVALRQAAVPDRINQQSLEIGRREVKLALTSRAIVDPARIQELKTVSSTQFDLSKLIRLCEELNLAFATESYLAMAMLTRAIIDHVPPIFGMKNFSEVANNYAGSSTLKRELKNLETTSRNIADLHLHSQIRRKEVLPTITQVDASNSLDLLLCEIIVRMSASI
ncbi:hypothetical protein [Rhizobium ruizarguesonis]|uniref:hypothetical protein n=1 Tax=Rhizobium ruizarguesonis TaxID=2081791 RepID=UPI001031A169|nr:hypothetical protein [Rhizobium ruizarguesonis]NEH81851.1 hypothetical protein [Rhizobium ruizarguesonis]NEI79467.1 hypothetical protein [Rhizobium ruizarguesonis]TBA20219.1 hypothetical protein ELH66_03940 [Rhizobium ruizarguesonis]TBD62654.1 hypothetical protein ELH22_04535 [Rhizobium ruizarguesonis]